MTKKPDYIFKIDKETEIPLFLPKGVFVPTGTSSLIIQAVKNYVKKPGKTLDLGSGSGVVGISLHKLGLVEAPLFCSDLSQDAVDCALKNAELHNCQIVVKTGALLDPWENKKFNCIIDDISGVAEEAAKISPWFDNVPCNSGRDGTALIVEVLKQATLFLDPGGLLFFPIVSFSNVNKILKVAKDNFSNVERLVHKEWFLPEEMRSHISILKRLKDEGHIEFQEKFGMLLWYTDVYLAYNSN